MSQWTCPRCGSKTLELRCSLELGPDGSDDEVSIQSLACGGCSFKAVGVYRESRRGASESWDHAAWPMGDAQAFRLLDERLASCEDPQNKRCACAAHEHFRVAENHCWVPLRLVPHDSQSRFTLR